MRTATIKRNIRDAFHKNLGPSASYSRTSHLIPKANSINSANLFKGKLYEVYVLSLLIQKLADDEGYTFQLQNGSSVLRMRPSPGELNRRYSWIDVFDGIAKIGEIWTSVEFATLSYSKSSRVGIGCYHLGDYHELDIGFFKDTPTVPHPSHDSVIIGIECKNTSMKKSILREVLGLRRELSLLGSSIATGFSKKEWKEVPANPPSLLMLYCTDSSVNNYTDPGDYFGIQLKHKSMM